jgi:short-subunit dehydrogenase
MGHRRHRAGLVTGASSGIGAALAWELSRRGTHVVLAARRVERLEALRERIEAAGGSAEVHALDVRDVPRLRAFVKQLDARLLERHGGLDLVVANAGVGLAEHASKLAWGPIETTLAVNVVGAFATLHAGLECMLPRGRGTLAGISSLASLGGYPGAGAYPASKAALATYLETLRIDLAGSGLRVVDVQPGFVVSEMTTGERVAHPVPAWLLVPVERAAEHIVRDLEHGRAISSFPASQSVPLRLLARAPRFVWRGLLGGLRRRSGA